MALAKELTGPFPAGQAGAIGGQGTTGITAAGTNSQANSTELTAGNNVIATAAANSGVRLPAGMAGDEVWVYNAGASTVNVYPPVGAAINSGGTNATFTLATTVSGVFKYVTPTVIIGMRSA